MSTTQLSPNGVMGIPYGTFAPKAEAGVIVRESGITQNLTFGPYVIGQYGSFSIEHGPDYLHGSLELCVTLTGDIRTAVYVDGEMQLGSHLGGRIEVNP